MESDPVYLLPRLQLLSAPEIICLEPASAKAIKINSFSSNYQWRQRSHHYRRRNTASGKANHFQKEDTHNTENQKKLPQNWWR